MFPDELSISMVTRRHESTEIVIHSSTFEDVVEKL
jgi:hypothetical protein